MLLVEPIVAILHNTKENRWHPIVFKLTPLPGNPEIKRYRSVGHHTKGFSNREEAIAYCRSTSEWLLKDARLELDTDIEWDGNEIPAMTVRGK